MSGEALGRLGAALADRYRIERELGAGGMATVYLAQDLKHDRQVAIKVLRPELAAVIGAERFVAEIRTTANLQHPHILPLFDSGVADSFLFYVMPYVEGISLRDRMTREKQLPIGEAVRIAGEIAGALDYAHRHGVIHRDIKPENILLHDGSALVADFGIALAASKAGTRMTETGMSLGTPQYMSPEQAMGERELDARSDIYALGCVTYEMLTGEPPFSGPTAQAIVAKVMTAEPAEISSLRKTVPEPVADAVHTALQKLPADRYTTAAEYAAALTGNSRNERRQKREVKGRSTSLVSRLSSLLLVVVAIVAIAAAIWFRMQLHSVPATSPVEFAITSGDDVPPSSATFTWPAAVSPDSRLLVYAGVGGAGAYQYYIRRIDQLTARALPGTANSTEPIFSPDSKWLAFESAVTGKLTKIPVDGGEPVPLANATGNNGGAWSSRGEIILGSEGAIQGLSRVPDGGGALVPLTKTDSHRIEFHLWPLILADGKTIVFTVEPGTQRDSAQLAITSLDDGVVHRIGVTGLRALGEAAGRLIYLDANGTVMAVPFDVGRRHTSGLAVAVLDSIAVCHSCNGDAPVYLSTSGALTYIRGSVPGRLTWIDRAGALRPAATDARLFSTPRISPDGRRIAVTVSADHDDIWLYDLATGTPTRLTSAGNNGDPEWSTDGRELFFQSDRSGKLALWHQESNLGGNAVMVRGTEGVLTAVASPDQRAVVVTTALSSNQMFWGRLGVDTPATALGQGSLARFAPDGRAIAYSSDESGIDEVYVRPFPETGTRIQLSAGGGSEPVWSADGRHVYYVNRGRMMEANLAPGTGLALASRDSLFAARGFGSLDVASYDVSRDGKNFLVVVPEERSVRLVVALNWGTELMNRLGKP